MSPKQYRELEAGVRFPDTDTWDRICKLYEWPQTFSGMNDVPPWPEAERLVDELGPGGRAKLLILLESRDEIRSEALCHECG